MATTEAYDALVQRLNPATVIVTAEADGDRSGCIVGFHTQCSIEPLRHCVWLSRANHTLRIARRARRLTVHVLGPDDLPVAELFGGETGDELDKWAELERRGLRLPGSAFSGLIVETLDDDSLDHVAFIIAPDEANEGDRTDSTIRISDLDHVEPGHAADDAGGGQPTSPRGTSNTSYSSSRTRR